MSANKHFDVQLQGDVTSLRFLDAKLFDHLLLTELQDQILSLVESSPPKKLLVDFSDVEFCSTSLINTLLRVKKLLMAESGQLKLCGMRTNVREAFQMLNLDGTVFSIHATPAEARLAFGATEG